jgi:hypothetical protein
MCASDLYDWHLCLFGQVPHGCKKFTVALRLILVRAAPDDLAIDTIVDLFKFFRNFTGKCVFAHTLDALTYILTV